MSEPAGAFRPPLSFSPPFLQLCSLFPILAAKGKILPRQSFVILLLLPSLPPPLSQAASFKGAELGWHPLAPGPLGGRGWGPQLGTYLVDKPWAGAVGI